LHLGEFFLYQNIYVDNSREIFPGVETGYLEDKGATWVNSVAQQNIVNFPIIEEAILYAQGVYAWGYFEALRASKILLKVFSAGEDRSIVDLNIRLQKSPDIRPRSAEVQVTAPYPNTWISMTILLMQALQNAGWLRVMNHYKIIRSVRVQKVGIQIVIL